MPEPNWLEHKVICPYCGKRAKLVSGSEVYPKWRNAMFTSLYVCKKCDARVGCHPGTAKPLGVPANAELRQARQRAHLAFDPIWKDRHMSRSYAYRWLAKSLGKSEVHIGESDLDTCREIESLSRKRLRLFELEQTKKARNT